MEFNATTIAGFLKGEIEGDPGAIVNTVAKIEEGQAWRSVISCQSEI